MPVSITIEDPDLATALQYAPSAGIPKLREWLADLQAHVHERPRGDYAISVGSGSQDLMFKGFQAVLNPGDPVLLETPMYAGVLPALRILKADYAEVDVDDQGLSAKNLEKVLSEWPADKKRPRVLYTSPIGSNPSGCSASKERKLEVLKVCKKYDVLIFEGGCFFSLKQRNQAYADPYMQMTLIVSQQSLWLQTITDFNRLPRTRAYSQLLRPRKAGLLRRRSRCSIRLFL